MDAIRGRPTARPSTFLPFVTLLLAGSLHGCSDGPTEHEGPPAATGKAWTLMVYDQADFANAFDILADCDRAALFSPGLLNQVRAGDHLSVLVLVDRESSPAYLLSINEAHQADTVEAWSEVNMGDPATLSAFVTFGKEHFPAERYILSVFGHGGGWLGACSDKTNGNDHLTMGEMRDALAQAGGVDLMLLNTPCLMGMVEVAYNLRNVTDVVLASEFMSGWVNEPMGDLSDALHANPGISTEALGSLFVNSIWEHRMVWENVGWPDSLTSSAIRTDRLIRIRDQIHALSVKYLQRPAAFRSHIATITPDLTSFKPSYVDLFDLADELLRVEQDQSTRAILESLKTALREAVVEEVHGPSWEDTHGLSIFLPESSTLSMLSLYPGPFYSLDLAQDTFWDELLLAAFGMSGSAQEAVGWTAAAPSSSLPNAGLPPGDGMACRGMLSGG
jgi:hypothetical protein